MCSIPARWGLLHPTGGLLWGSPEAPRTRLSLVLASDRSWRRIEGVPSRSSPRAGIATAPVSEYPRGSVSEGKPALDARLQACGEGPSRVSARRSRSYRRDMTDTREDAREVARAR